MRSATAAFVGAVILGTGVLLLSASVEKSELAFTLGVVPDRIAVNVEPGRAVCQTPVYASEPFAALQIIIGTHRRPGPPLVVTVRDLLSGRTLARGRLWPGYPDNSRQTVELERPAPAQPVSVCVRTPSPRPFALYGGAGAAVYEGTARKDGIDVGADVAMIFLRDERKPLPALLPDVLGHASVFHAGWTGPWVFWLLAAAVLLAVPALLALALRTAERPG